VSPELPQPPLRNGAGGPWGDRDRLVAAISKAAAEHGYEALTIEQITGYAGLSREAFDAHFDSREQGLMAAQEVFLKRLLAEASSACEGAAPWPVRLRAGLQAVLASLIESYALARVFTVEADAAGLALAERQLVALDDFARLMRAGRDGLPDTATLPTITERLLVGGVASLVRERLLLEEQAVPPPLEAELTELLLIPYVGRAEARRVALEPLA
jgi:AcrR family transcriptional regulator